ncbi:MAG: 50S ribosomal protein L18 [Planctomycetes bacterium]|nr:50S ribosomal protein L18 [Planctomycetota bacterium]
MSQSTQKKKAASRLRRKRHIRHAVSGSAARPRLSVYRSLTNIYAQLIDDDAGRTLAAAASLEEVLRTATVEGGKSGRAEAVGKLLAERAKEKGIVKVVFDRNGFRFHGRVKALAEAARKAGLEF